MNRKIISVAILLLTSFTVSCSLLNAKKQALPTRQLSVDEKVYLDSAKKASTQYPVFSEKEADAQMEKARVFLVQYFEEPTLQTPNENNKYLDIDKPGKYKWRVWKTRWRWDDIKRKWDYRMRVLCIGYDAESQPLAEENMAILAYYMQSGKPLPVTLIHKDQAQ